MLKEWQKARELNIPISIYDHLKNYFGYLNTGYKNNEMEIFAYNGGLFKPDEILDNLTISDDVLYKHIKKLADYDFASEVDVNILGHIFENSLTEIDEIKAQINGEVLDKTQTKRKKDGVFYTPKYITSYIVQNTVGQLCQSKKAELDINDEDYIAGRQKKTQEKLFKNLQSYREWLLAITICDPACGSGAFLNEALNFLIAEHRYIDELESKLTGSTFTYQNVSNHILEHNLYGVDINSESVEIAKLSLWLRTAEPHRKLSNLNENIKCGNSLIDDENVAGDKAFNWQKEFPTVFANGGFDVVIGNPPYVRQELLNKNDKEWLSKSYQSGNGTADLYVYFYEKSLHILKENGLLGFITPNKFYKTSYGKNLREFLQQYSIIEMIDFFELPVFEDASTDSQILILTKNKQVEQLTYSPIKTIESFILGKYDTIEISQQDLDSSIWIFNNLKEQKILNKMKLNATSLGEYTNNGVYRGLLTGLNEAFIIDQETRDEIIKNDPKSEEIICSYIAPTDINRYSLNTFKKLYFINTGYNLDISQYKGTYNWLMQFNDALQKRQDKGVHHFNLRACRYYDLFDKPKIIYIYTAVNHNFYYDDEGYYINNSAYFISSDDKFLSTWLNSKIFQFYKRLNFVAYGDSATRGRVKLDLNKMINVPIPNLSNTEKQPFIEKADLMLSLNKDLQETINKFLRTLNRKFDLSDFSKNLQSWYLLSYKDLIKELAKKKIKLSLSDESEWEDYFIAEQKKAVDLQEKINKTDDEINQMVYQLYGLTHDEINIIEQQ